VDGAVGGGAIALHRQAELPGNGLVHIEHVAGGKGHVEQAVEPRVQAGAQLPAHGGLAAADLAGDEPDAAQLHQMLQARLSFARGAGSEQLIGLQGALEGVMGKAEVSEIH
jgi:hypothetical protein